MSTAENKILLHSPIVRSDNYTEKRKDIKENMNRGRLIISGQREHASLINYIRRFEKQRESRVYPRRDEKGDRLSFRVHICVQ